MGFGLRLACCLECPTCERIIDHDQRAEDAKLVALCGYEKYSLCFCGQIVSIEDQTEEYKRRWDIREINHAR